MKWNFKPYVPFGENADRPYICRIEPLKNSIAFEWLDNSFDETKKYTLFFAQRDSNVYEAKRLQTQNAAFEVKPDADYKFYVECSDGRRSIERLAGSGDYPGKVINYLHPDDCAYSFSGRYLASPSIVRLNDGCLVASMDIFAGKQPSNITLLYKSKDNGESWEYMTELFPCFWATLFVHKNKLYAFSASTEYGDLLIGCSEDGGQSWTAPVVIGRGSGRTEHNGFHKAPVNILNALGRLWIGIEWGSWSNKRFDNTVFSIDENDDLLCAESWKHTAPLKHNPEWPNAEQVAGGIEGNMVLSPQNELLYIARYAPDKCLVLKADAENPERMLEFVKICDFPLGNVKFEIRQIGKLYYAAGNTHPGRTVLAMYTSENLTDWNRVCDIISTVLPADEVGFQYPSICGDGNELIVLSRTAVSGAKSFHDTNCITMHRVKK